MTPALPYNKLTRDAKAILATLGDPPDPKAPIIAKKNIKYIFPDRYIDRDMAFVGSHNKVTGIGAIVVDDKYAVLSVCAVFDTEPTSQKKVNYLGRDYIEFEYEAGSRFMVTKELVKLDVLVYRIFDEFINKGNVPWFMGYEDMAGIFDTALKHAGTALAESVEVTEMIISLTTRTQGDMTKYFRTEIKSREDLVKKNPKFIGIINAAYAPTNTLGRTMGSYFDVGVTASMVYPTKRIESMEAIIRG